MIPKGYNMTEGDVGGKWSQELKENMSKAISDKWQDKEYREKKLKARQKIRKDLELFR
jgi:hypothetical protein